MPLAHTERSFSFSSSSLLQKLHTLYRPVSMLYMLELILSFNWILMYLYHLDFFVKLVFDIAVVQQTRTHDRTLEEVVDPIYPPVPAVRPLPIFGPFFAQLC